MIKLRKNPASRHDKNPHHASYGIYNYMNKNGVSNNDTQLEIINAYMKLHKLKSDGKISNAEVIQKDFKAFAKFFKDFKKMFLDNR